jgi:uncharacterized damage-inducible protein DinB
MIEQMKWTDRTFAFNLPAGCFPAVLERLRGTPLRAADLVKNATEEVLSARFGGGWSVKEHIGHLQDLSALDEIRLGEFLAGAPVLTAADVTNRATESADHNARAAAAIIEELRRSRTALVERLEGLSVDQVSASALHRRLQQKMRLIDWVSFVSEHDDHHLARARAVLRRLQA